MCIRDRAQVVATSFRKGEDPAQAIAAIRAKNLAPVSYTHLEKGAQGGNLGKVAKEILDSYFSTTVQRETSPQEGLLQ